MARKPHAWALVLGGLGLWGAVLAGCTSTMPNVRPTPLMVEMMVAQGTATPVPFPAPLLWVQVGTENTYGMFSRYEVSTLAGSQTRGDGWWPQLTAPQPPRLTVQAGQSITLKHDQPTAPSFLVIEVDEQNQLLHSTVIRAPGNQYVPIATGTYRLSVRAWWRYRNETTYFFNMEVKP